MTAHRVWQRSPETPLKIEGADVDAARVRVHIVATDDDRRMLLARRRGTSLWTLPWTYLRIGEDPLSVARALVHDSGALPSMPRVHSIESTIEHGNYLLDLTYGCTAERIWKSRPADSSALWWSLGEISSLELAKRATGALVHVWPQLWPQP